MHEEGVWREGVDFRFDDALPVLRRTPAVLSELLVAAGIVAAVLGFGNRVGSATVQSPETGNRIVARHG